MRVVEAITSEQIRAGAIVAVARGQARTGDFTEALRTARPVATLDAAAVPARSSTEPDYFWIWPSTLVRCAAAIFPESEVDRTHPGRREDVAHDPEAP